MTPKRQKIINYKGPPPPWAFLESQEVEVLLEGHQALKVQVAQVGSFRLQDIPCRAEQSLHDWGAG